MTIMKGQRQLANSNMENSSHSNRNLCGNFEQYGGILSVICKTTDCYISGCGGKVGNSERLPVSLVVSGLR